MTTAISSPGIDTDLLAQINGGNKKSKGQSDADASQDRFLKLLVAQLNNQDPMNPMDNAQMTSQMAQINTVSGIQQVNETIKSLSTQFATLQSMQGAAMIGHDVLTSGNALAIKNGKAGGSIDLPANADKVSLQIYTPGGQLFETVNLGAMSAGRNSFVWDASQYTGGGSPSFKVLATQGGQSMASTTLSRATVSGIGNDNGVMSIQLQGRSAVTYDEIKAIL